MIDFNNEKFDIVILAGQSNAIGYGLGETDSPFKESDKIYH